MMSRVGASAAVLPGGCPAAPGRGRAGSGGVGVGSATGGRNGTPTGGEAGLAPSAGCHQDSESCRGAAPGWASGAGGACGADRAGETDRAVPGWSGGGAAGTGGAAGAWGMQRSTGPSSGFPSRTTQAALI